MIMDTLRGLGRSLMSFLKRYTGSHGCTALITHAGFISSSSFYLPSEDSVERIRKLVIMVGDP